jgi:hypothetical protein
MTNANTTDTDTNDTAQSESDAVNEVLQAARLLLRKHGLRAEVTVRTTSGREWSRDNF